MHVKMVKTGRRSCFYDATLVLARGRVSRRIFLRNSPPPFSPHRYGKGITRNIICHHSVGSGKTVDDALGARDLSGFAMKPDFGPAVKAAGTEVEPACMGTARIGCS